MQTLLMSQTLQNVVRSSLSFKLFFKLHEIKFCAYHHSFTLSGLGVKGGMSYTSSGLWNSKIIFWEPVFLHYMDPWTSGQGFRLGYKILYPQSSEGNARLKCRLLRIQMCWLITGACLQPAAHIGEESCYR